MKWRKAAAKTRATTADALATVTPALVVDDVPDRPEVETLRRALVGWSFNVTRRDDPQPDDIRAALAWVERYSLPLERFADPQVRPLAVRMALDACTLRMDGKAAAATTGRRKRAVLYNVFGYAVELGHLPANPIDTVQWKAPRVAEEVDRRVVASPAQVRELLTAATYVGRLTGPRLRAFFALLYFAALRPSEALEVRKQDCRLPDSGGGLIVLEGSRAQAGKAWTDDGERTEKRTLKWRGRREVRRVPIPPELVTILRQHLDTYGAADDGRLFRTSTGGHVTPSAYDRAWDAARRYGLTPEAVQSPLAGRPYDLRHGGVTLWLNAGVPAPEVARRAGHGVDVLLKIYAGCIDGEEDVANRRIEEALGSPGRFAGCQPDSDSRHSATSVAGGPDSKPPAPREQDEAARGRPAPVANPPNGGYGHPRDPLS
jgi:integrase